MVQFTTGFKGPFTPTESRNESEKDHMKKTQEECIPVGCVPSAAVATYAPPPRRRPPAHLWTEFLTHTFEDITFPQLPVRTVKIKEKFRFLSVWMGPNTCTLYCWQLVDSADVYLYCMFIY